MLMATEVVTRALEKAVCVFLPVAVCVQHSLPRFPLCQLFFSILGLL
jgi:hypothetical protein